MLLSVYFHLQSLRSVLPLVVLTGVFPHITCAQLLTLAATSILPRGAYAAVDEWIYDAYQSLMCFFFEEYCGSTVLFYGDLFPTERKENVIYLCNHQSSVDWVVSDLMAIRQGSLGRLRYIMKNGLKQLPMYGFTFAQHGCIFVSKHDEKNEAKLARKLNDIVRRKANVWMVIFPEGTRFNPNKKATIERSQEFSRDQGLEVHEHVLVPRSRGIEMLVQHLGGYVDAVYDVTIAYRNENKALLPRMEGPSLTEFVAEAGEEIHVHLNRIERTDLPKEKSDIKEWLHGLFSRKERLLAYFYDEHNGGKFPGPCSRIPVPAYRTKPYFIVFSAILIASLATARNRSLYAKVTLALGSGTVLYMNTLFNVLQSH